MEWVQIREKIEGRYTKLNVLYVHNINNQDGKTTKESQVKVRSIWTPPNKVIYFQWKTQPQVG